MIPGPSAGSRERAGDFKRFICLFCNVIVRQQLSKDIPNYKDEIYTDLVSRDPLLESPVHLVGMFPLMFKIQLLVCINSLLADYFPALATQLIPTYNRRYYLCQQTFL